MIAGTVPWVDTSLKPGYGRGLLAEREGDEGGDQGSPARVPVDQVPAGAWSDGVWRFLGAG